MKRISVILTTLCLIISFAALSLSGGALAEDMSMPSEDSASVSETDAGTPVAGKLCYNEYSAYMGWHNSENENWRLIDAHGEPVTEAIYTDMTIVRNYNPEQFFFKVSINTGDPANRWGLLSPDGAQLVPPRYIDARIINSRWSMGITAREVTGEPRDYVIYDRKAGIKRFYVIEAADFYLDGAFVGSLGRDDFSGGEVTAYGEYIAVERPDAQYGYFDKTMKRSPVVTSYSVEYDYDYDYDRGGAIYIHCGSGMEAFTPGCTLTASEVEEPYQSDYDDQIVDLQGNVVLKLSEEYSYASNYYSQYIKVRVDDKYGLIDYSGREILPPEFDDIGTYGYEPFSNGYVYAEKNDRFGYYDVDGSATCPFMYPTYKNYETQMFMQIENPDGSYTVMSASSGELPETYMYVSYIRDGAAVFAAQHFDETWCVVDDRGNALLDGITADSLWVNASGTLAVASLGENSYMLYPIG